MYGSFSKSMQTALRPYVAGKRVVDLGSGDGTRAVLLTAIGAQSILAIDGNGSMRSSPRIEYVQSAFSTAAALIRKAKPDVAHVAWPTSRLQIAEENALVEILAKIQCVVYVGCNTDCTSCGTPALFRHFMRRPVSAIVRERRNTLIVYGAVGSRIRKPADIEERAGLCNDDADQMFSYDGSRITKSTWKRIDANAERRVDRMTKADIASGRRNGFTRVAGHWVPIERPYVPIEQLFMALINSSWR